VRGPSLCDARKNTPIAMYRNGEVVLTSGCERADTATTIDHCYITDLLTEETSNPERSTLFAAHKTYGWHRSSLLIDQQHSSHNITMPSTLQLHRRETCGVVTSAGTLHIIGGGANEIVRDLYFSRSSSASFIALHDHIVIGSQRATSANHILYRQPPPGAARRAAAACATDTHIYFAGVGHISYPINYFYCFHVACHLYSSAFVCICMII
jgi:hypothetical protein